MPSEKKKPKVGYTIGPVEEEEESASDSDEDMELKDNGPIWFYLIKRQTKGPVPFSRIRTLWKSKRLTNKTYVYTAEYLEDWTPLETVLSRRLAKVHKGDEQPYFIREKLVEDMVEPCVGVLDEQRTIDKLLSKGFEEDEARLAYRKALYANDAMERERKRRSATAVQSHFRGYKLRQIMREQKKAAIIVQKNLRGYQVRKKEEMLHVSLKAKKRREDLLREIQRRQKQSVQPRRHTVERTHEMDRHLNQANLSDFDRCLSEAVVWQWNHIMAITQHKREPRAAAIYIQRFWRRYRSKRVKQEQVNSLAILALARGVRDAGHERDYTNSRDVIEDAMILQSSALLLQRIERGRQARKRISYERERVFLRAKAAIKIQAAFRRHFNSRKFRRSRSAAIDIQRVERGRKQRKKHKQKIKVLQEEKVAREQQEQLEQQSAVKVQCMIRTRHARRRVTVLKEEKQNKILAAGAIQRNWRLHVAVRHQKRTLATFLLQRYYEGPAVKIQALFRGAYARIILLQQRRLELLVEKKNHAITRIQAIARGVIERIKVKKRKEHLETTKFLSCVLVVQSVARVFLKRKRILRERREIAALRIQCVARGMFGRRAAVFKADSMRNASVVSIQCLYRQHLARKTVIRRRRRLEKIKNQVCAIIMQAAYRGHLARRRYKKRLVRRFNLYFIMSVVRVQSLCRNMVARNRAERARLQRSMQIMIGCCQTIQRVFRNRKRVIFAMKQEATREMDSFREKVHIIERIYLRHVLTKRLILKRYEKTTRKDELYAVRIQALQRGRRDRGQSAARLAHLEARNIMRNERAVVIQSMWRGAIARNNFSKFFLEAGLRKTLRDIAAKRVQSLARGFLTRKRLEEGTLVPGKEPSSAEESQKEESASGATTKDDCISESDMAMSVSGSESDMKSEDLEKPEPDKKGEGMASDVNESKIVSFGVQEMKTFHEGESPASTARVDDAAEDEEDFQYLEEYEVVNVMDRAANRIQAWWRGNLGRRYSDRRRRFLKRFGPISDFIFFANDNVRLREKEDISEAYHTLYQPWSQNVTRSTHRGPHVGGRPVSREKFEVRRGPRKTPLHDPSESVVEIDVVNMHSSLEKTKKSKGKRTARSASATGKTSRASSARTNRKQGFRDVPGSIEEGAKEIEKHLAGIRKSFYRDNEALHSSREEEGKENAEPNARSVSFEEDYESNALEILLGKMNNIRTADATAAVTGADDGGDKGSMNEYFQNMERQSLLEMMEDDEMSEDGRENFANEIGAPLHPKSTKPRSVMSASARKSSRGHINSSLRSSKMGEERPSSASPYYTKPVTIRSPSPTLRQNLTKRGASARGHLPYKPPRDPLLRNSLPAGITPPSTNHLRTYESMPCHSGTVRDNPWTDASSERQCIMVANAWRPPIVEGVGTLVPSPAVVDDTQDRLNVPTKWEERVPKFRERLMQQIGFYNTDKRDKEYPKTYAWKNSSVLNRKRHHLHPYSLRTERDTTQLHRAKSSAGQVEQIIQPYASTDGKRPEVVDRPSLLRDRPQTAMPGIPVPLSSKYISTLSHKAVREAENLNAYVTHPTMVWHPQLNPGDKLPAFVDENKYEEYPFIDVGKKFEIEQEVRRGIYGNLLNWYRKKGSTKGEKDVVQVRPRESGRVMVL